ncbi:MAG: excinuclease ABC subunit B [Hungatella sp.]|nr:excinuclease ABC subunit B [Hungatella sp.]
MLCERCKIREANIQYTEVINGVKTEHNFCAQCAKEMDFGPYSAIFDGEFPLAQLLSGLLGGEMPVQKKDRLSQVTCPTCSMSYEEFVNNSCFGCADCYSIFDPLIHDNIKQLQGSDSHKGKRPLYQDFPEESRGDAAIVAEEETAKNNNSAKQQLRAWERKLKEALRVEDYENAAAYRDRIRALKEGMEADA